MPFRGVVLNDAVNGPFTRRSIGVHFESTFRLFHVLVFLVLFVLGYRCGSPCVVLDGLCAAKAFVRNIKNEVVKVVAMRRVVPSYQTLVNIIDIANKVGERLAD